MSTALLDRPASLGGRDTRGPGRRALVRWAWRLFRREWRQQLLVLALVTVAVAATILGAAIATNTPPPANAGFGTADHLVNLPADPHLAAEVNAIGAQVGTIDVIENETIATGLVQGAQLRQQDPHGAYGQPMLALVSGHYPSGGGEVAMTQQLAATFGLHVGDLWHQGGRARRIVGVVENPQNLLDNFALLAPGQLHSPTQTTVLFNAPPTKAALTLPHGVTAVTPQGSGGISPAVIVFAVAIIGLIFVGLVAVAGFAVLAQRRLRGLGMLSSLGATDADVRLVMVANGVVVGVVSALIGAVIGLAVWIGYAPHLATSAHHRVSWTDLPWWLVAATLVLAILTTTLASRRPARVVSQVPVVTALSGRPAPSKGVHRSAVPGVVLVLLGVVLLVFSGGWGSNGGKGTLFQLGGLLACAVGQLLLAPLVVAMLGANARRAPIGLRIALRDLARYQARSGAALAATSFAVLIAMLIILITTGRFADRVDYFGPNLPANQLVVYTPAGSPDGGPSPAGPAPQGQPQQTPAQLQTDANTIARSVRSHSVLALDSTDAMVVRATSHAGHGAIYVATPALLARYHIDSAAIDARTILITSRPGLQGTSGLQLLYGGGGKGAPPQVLNNPKIQNLAGLPTDASAPNLLVTPYAVQRLGLQTSAGGWLIQAPDPLSAAQINTARQLAAGAGMTIETKSEAPSLDQLRNYAAAAGMLLALGVLAMTVGLIRSETAGELRTLTATGASSGTRRTITAATAGAIGLLGAVLGTAVAYLATVAFFRSELSERMGNAPVLDLLLILVGLPVAAACGGWLFGGRQPPVIAHQPIE